MSRKCEVSKGTTDGDSDEIVHFDATLTDVSSCRGSALESQDGTECPNGQLDTLKVALHQEPRQDGQVFTETENKNVDAFDDDVHGAAHMTTMQENDNDESAFVGRKDVKPLTGIRRDGEPEHSSMSAANKCEVSKRVSHGESGSAFERNDGPSVLNSHYSPSKHGSQHFDIRDLRHMLLEGLSSPHQTADAFQNTCPEIEALVVRGRTSSDVEEVKQCLVEMHLWIRYFLGQLAYEQEKSEHLEALLRETAAGRDKAQREAFGNQLAKQQVEMSLDGVKQEINRLIHERDSFTRELWDEHRAQLAEGMSQDEPSEAQLLRQRCALSERTLRSCENELAVAKVRLATLKGEMASLVKLLQVYGEHVRVCVPSLYVDFSDPAALQTFQLTDAQRVDVLQLPTVTSPATTSTRSAKGWSLKGTPLRTWTLSAAHLTKPLVTGHSGTEFEDGVKDGESSTVSHKLRWKHFNILGGKQKRSAVTPRHPKESALSGASLSPSPRTSSRRSSQASSQSESPSLHEKRQESSLASISSAFPS